jgi:hypothetical protein
MAEPQQAESAVSQQSPDQLMRDARALIGWIDKSEAELVLVGRRSDIAATPEQKRLAERARESVHDRTSGVDQGDLVRAVPPNLSNHVVRLRSAAGQYFAEGWRVAMVDLTRVVAVQPTILCEAASERVDAVDTSDLQALAELCLPTTPQEPTGAQFDPSRQAWIFSSRNPNLRIAGNFTGEIQPGVSGYGFVVQTSPSYLQVASYKGRHLLRDGYHRAYGLLCRGVSNVPAFVRTFSSVAELALPPGMLPQEAYLGERPPSLPDYLDDAVSIDVKLPAIQKLVLVQATELTPVG